MNTRGREQAFPQVTQYRILLIDVIGGGAGAVAQAGIKQKLYKPSALHISRNWRSKGLRGIRSLRNSMSIEMYGRIQ